MKLFVAFFLAFFASIVLNAQAAVVQYDQQVFAPGVNTVTGSPIWTNTYTASAAVCNQTAPTIPSTVINPTQVLFDDVINPGKVCIIQLASSLLPALPNGSGYVTTLTQTDNLGQTSARSAASNPFSKQGVPATLSNVRVK